MTIEYCKVLKKYKYEVSSVSHIFLWPLFCILVCFYGNFLYFKIIFKSIFNLFKKNKKIDHYFFGISDYNIPLKNKDNNFRKSYDLISWFNDYYKKNLGQSIIVAHDNKKIKNKTTDNTEIIYYNEPWFFLDGFFKIIVFLFFGFILSIISLILVFFNKCSAAFLFPEILKAVSTVLADKNKISQKYMFHYSDSYYRPLWTYIISDDKERIISYFYSAYDSPLNSRSNEIGHAYEFGNITWPTILVWDEIQNKKISKYIRNDIVDMKIVNTGPIWFTDTNFTFKDSRERLIIFDMTVHRASVHYGFYDTAEYTDQVDNFNCIFLSDIFKTFKSSKYEIILKRKRPNNYLKTNYRNVVKKFINEGLKVIDEPVSAHYLIKNSNIVFSTPFTSANLMTDNYKNNFYYDPLKKIFKNDPASRGLPIISGLDELNLLKNNLNEY